MRYNDKKIGVSFFANTKLKPIEVDGKSLYKLYANIVYDRKSSTIKVTYLDGESPYVDENLDLLKTDYHKTQSKKYEDFVLEVILFELENEGHLDLKGLGKRIDHYSKNVYQCIKNYTVSFDRMKEIMESGDVVIWLKWYSLIEDHGQDMTVFEWFHKGGAGKIDDLARNLEEEAEGVYHIENETFNNLLLRAL